MLYIEYAHFLVNAVFIHSSQTRRRMTTKAFSPPVAMVNHVIRRGALLKGMSAGITFNWDSKQETEAPIKGFSTYV